MSRPMVIALDLGTTHAKAAAVDAAGRVRAIGSAAVPTRLGPQGRVEQEGEAVWRAAGTALRAVTATVDRGSVAGVCLGGAMHSVMPVDGQGRPLAPSMTWADGRGIEQTTRLREATDPGAIYRRTGCPLRPQYHAPRLRWWIEEQPEISKLAARFVALRDLVAFRLTGRWATDRGLASTTGLLNLRSGDWDEEALRLAGVERGRLPELIDPGDIVGQLAPGVARRLGLTAGTPVLACGSDGALANLGAGGAAPGSVVITVGTSGAVRLSTARPLLDRHERTWCYRLMPGRWIAGGAINNGGLAAQWVCDRFYASEREGQAFVRMMDEAAEVGPGGDGLIAMPYLSGERSPWWRPDLKAALACVSLRHTRAHLARAVLEGVAFCLADVAEALGLKRRGVCRAMLTGGIVRSPAWCQIVADVLGMELHASERGDASAIGAALMGLDALNLLPLDTHAPAGRPGLIRCRPDARRHALYRGLCRERARLRHDLVLHRDGPA